MIPEKLRRFVENFEGMNKGRYHIMYMTLISIAGGEEMRKEAQAKYGRPTYLPDKMYPTREQNLMAFYAIERGVSAERLGRMLPQTYKRANPGLYDKINRDNAVELLVAAFDAETDYAKDSTRILERSPGRAVIERKINPMPCEFFKGALLEHFAILGVPCQVEEIKCQWREDHPTCVYEVTWQ